MLIGDRRNKPILFLHGFMGNGADFYPVVEELAEFCCLLVDLPGHGLTQVNGNEHYQMPQVALSLISLLEKLDINSCLLTGYSMGGRLALYLIIYFPEYFCGGIWNRHHQG